MRRVRISKINGLIQS
jgi:hypothetical protein